MRPLLLAAALALAACGTDTPAASGEAVPPEAVPAEAHTGALEVRGARATPAPAGRTAGAFMTLTGGAEADTLLAARFAGAARTEVHESVETADGLRGMREVAAVPIPADETVALRPGGYHLMLMDLAAPLAVGDTVSVELVMARAGAVPVRVAVRPVEEVRSPAE